MESLGLISEEEFFDYLGYLLNIVKDECHKRIANAEEAAHVATKNGNLQWYFRGYKDGVGVFLREFWDRMQREEVERCFEASAIASSTLIVST